MLRAIEITNFILISKVRMDFTSGLNIFTGETGTGKSVIINAISQLCGERSSPDLVKSGETKAVIEAELENNRWPQISVLVEKNNLNISQDDNLIIIRKEIYSSGNNRIFVNDSPVTLNILTELTEPLIDLHGQHQHQRLLRPEYHIQYLDDFGNLNEVKRQFSDLLKIYNRKIKDLENFKKQQAEAAQKQDIYQFQLKELKESNLDEDEYPALQEEKRRLDNIEVLNQLSARLAETLYSGEYNAGDFLSKAEADLHELTHYDDQFLQLLDSIKSAREAVEEVGRFSASYIENLEYDAQRMEYLNNRINHLDFILKKYHKENIRELTEYRDQVEQLIENIDSFDDKTKNIEKEILEIREKVISVGKDLSSRRKEIALLFAEAITNTLKQIGMPHALFSVSQNVRTSKHSLFVINNIACIPDDNGFDDICFEIQSNPGDKGRPIHKIASGGEISRIMLAIKSALAANDQIAVMVFDEIDSGISGKIAQIVGKKMKDLAKNHQILCVTHLPQIAVFAEQHFKVVKNLENGRTNITVMPVKDENRINEIATLLAGEEVAFEAIENAKRLISETKNMEGSH
ncbi:MAG: DNA repair protein RecN [Calditrichaceae bacterium]|nr:DNA repair protein RecN [Calditrichaceae bacterium]MBN2707438.1 DNA repair protein RecN [Calditrichaceae bacterium]RQV94006.1 MAG: DNA repair protein RecN [Calditrichota bacterium]